MADIFQPGRGFFPEKKRLIPRYTFWGDLEHCPFVPSDPEYANWHEKDDARLNELSENRKELRYKANQYMSYDDRNVRNMAIFISWILDE